MEPCHTPATRELTVWELVLLNCIVCGLELVASAALVYLPPMLLEAGFSEEYMSWILGAGPFLCLFIVPVLGQWMDTCQSKYGRRIPFMFGLSLIVIAALILIPYADHMTVNDLSSSFNIHAYLLAFGVILIDFGTQAGLTPCEVFLQDVTKGSAIRDRAFGLYSLMCSLGSCAGYLILAVKWEATVLGRVFGDQEYCVFFLLAVFLICLMILNIRAATRIRSRLNIASHPSYANLEKLTPSHSQHATLSKLPAPSSLSAVRRLIMALTPKGIIALCNIPYVLQRLVLANFFSWAGVMCFLLFYTDYIGEIVYEGKPSAPVGTDLRLQYDEGVRMGSFGLLLHAVTSSVAAPAIEKLENRFGMKRIHLSALALFSIVVTLIMLTNNVIIINMLAMCTGIAFASMTTIPFSLVGMYHEDKEVFFADVYDASGRGIGVDMATLDTAYFLSQVLLLSVTGYILHLTHTARTYLIMSASLALVSCYFINTVVYSEDEFPVQIRRAKTEQTNGISITVTKADDYTTQDPS